jgi:hypothetical protein
MEELTLEKLKLLQPNQIFASGIGKILHPWFNDATNIDSNNMTPVKWVAVRGGIHDWAIYHSMDANLCKAEFFDSSDHLATANDQIANHGAKLYNPDKIREFVPCNDEAFKMYRY